MDVELIYIDNHLIVVRKPAGVLIQGDYTKNHTLLETVRDYLKKEYCKPGNVYLGLVHRLDRPVSGVIVCARTSKAAARLSEQFRNHTPIKIYWALVQGKTRQKDHLVDYIHRNRGTSSITDQTEGKRAELSYTRLDYYNGISFVRIVLQTGRHHQIRVQFAHRKHPILGDLRYGSTIRFPRKTIALHARSITIQHPTKGEPMTFTADPENIWPKRFSDDDRAAKISNTGKSI